MVTTVEGRYRDTVGTVTR